MTTCVKASIAIALLGSASCMPVSSTDAGTDSSTPGDAPAPRLIAPGSTSSVTSRRPTLRWLSSAGSTGAHVQICSDRACTRVEQEFDAEGNAGAPGTAVRPGVHFWRARSNRGTAYSATWQFWLGLVSSPVDTSWGSTLDVNGDGLADVMVASEYGSLSLYLGTMSGPSSMATPVMQNVEHVASAGDVNGDGFGDVIASHVNANAYLFLGSAAGLTPSTMIARSGVAAAAGDVNGDGYADVLTTSTLLLGTANGLSATGIRPTAPGERVIYVLASAGDVNGDGFGDVIGGSYGVIPTDRGAAYLFAGSAEGLSTTPITLADPSGSNGFGFSVGCAGDTNADGYADIIVGVAGEFAYVYLGSAAGPSATPIRLGAPGAVAQFAVSLAGAGDVNGDGFADVIIGDWGANQAYVYLGGAEGSAMQAATTLRGTPGSASFGYAVAAAGDVNHDGYDDVLVGAPGPGLGEAFLFRGGNGGLDVTPIPFVRPAAGSGFGFSVAALPNVVIARHRLAGS